MITLLYTKKEEKFSSYSLVWFSSVGTSSTGGGGAIRSFTSTGEVSSTAFVASSGTVSVTGATGAGSSFFLPFAIAIIAITRTITNAIPIPNK